MFPRIIVVMGVSGAGKTTIGEALAARLGWPFQDADALHPRANIVKMASGQPLSDADRAPWLVALRDWVAGALEAGRPGVLAASLLKRAYRQQVTSGDPRVALVYLHADPRVLRRRIQARTGHFMPAALLDSQFDTLEPPVSGEHAVMVEVGGTPEEAVDAALAGLADASGAAD